MRNNLVKHLPIAFLLAKIEGVKKIDKERYQINLNGNSIAFNLNQVKAVVPHLCFTYIELTTGNTIKLFQNDFKLC